MCYYNVYFLTKQVLQQAQSGFQIVAQQGPNGTITYSAVPQFQTVNMDGSGDSNAVQNQQLAMASQQQAVQTIPVMTANGQIVRAQIPTASTMPTNLFGGNMGNMVNLGGNLVNIGGVQTLNAVRPGGIIQSISMQNAAYPQVQQFPNIVQIPVSANGQTAYMPVQMQQIQTVQDLSQVTNAISTSVGTGLVAGALQQSAQMTQIIDSNAQVTSKPQTSTVTKFSAAANKTASAILFSSQGQASGTTTSQAQNVGMQGQTIAAAAAAANIIPQMQLIPVGNGSYMQAAVFPSQASMASIGNGQNMITIASLSQSSTAATTTTNATNTVASPQQNITVSNAQPIIQAVAGQPLQGIQLTGQGQVIASPGQVINLSNLKNGQYPFQIQNMQGIQTLQGLQGFQNMTQMQTVSGQQTQSQIPQIIGTPLAGLQGLQAVTVNAQGNLTAVPVGNTQQQITAVSVAGQQNIQSIQQLQQGLPAQIIAGIQNIQVIFQIFLPLLHM